MSLPHRFKTEVETIPADLPYLRPDPALVAKWQEVIGIRPKKQTLPLRVGLVWAGRPEHTSDRYRSISAELLAPLASVPDVEWFSLQKGTDETVSPRRA